MASSRIVASDVSWNDSSPVANPRRDRCAGNHEWDPDL